MFFLKAHFDMLKPWSKIFTASTSPILTSLPLSIRPRSLNLQDVGITAKPGGKRLFFRSAWSLEKKSSNDTPKKKIFKNCEQKGKTKRCCLFVKVMVHTCCYFGKLPYHVIWFTNPSWKTLGILSPSCETDPQAIRGKPGAIFSTLRRFVAVASFERNTPELETCKESEITKIWAG